MHLLTLVVCPARLSAGIFSAHAHLHTISHALMLDMQVCEMYVCKLVCTRVLCTFVREFAASTLNYGLIRPYKCCIEAVIEPVVINVVQQCTCYNCEVVLY